MYDLIYNQFILLVYLILMANIRFFKNVNLQIGRSVNDFFDQP